jgi:translation elongation factor EF-4
MTSAKQFKGIDEVIKAIVDTVPSPADSCGLMSDKFKGRIVDSWYEEHRGLVCLGENSYMSFQLLDPIII